MTPRQEKVEIIGSARGPLEHVARSNADGCPSAGSVLYIVCIHSTQKVELQLEGKWSSAKDCQGGQRAIDPESNSQQTCLLPAASGVSVARTCASGPEIKMHDGMGFSGVP